MLLLCVYICVCVCAYADAHTHKCIYMCVYWRCIYTRAYVCRCLCVYVRVYHIYVYAYVHKYINLYTTGTCRVWAPRTFESCVRGCSALEDRISKETHTHGNRPNIYGKRPIKEAYCLDFRYSISFAVSGCCAQEDYCISQEIRIYQNKPNTYEKRPTKEPYWLNSPHCISAEFSGCCALEHRSSNVRIALIYIQRDLQKSPTAWFSLFHIGYGRAHVKRDTYVQKWT